ncbi:protein TsetseEP-like [Eupeodes corollae]|uniref:protein TsetseEP-like n=1 Tax=Eupeodes corollae TaxID=290404 RepID=UPI0024927528|nr:protein TsetseEP-like [Eupeodes corollae]
MNFNIIIFFITTCFLSTSLASIRNQKVNRVHTEVMSYVQEKMGNNSFIRARGYSAHLECYNGFIPLINYLAANAKEASYYCVSDAEKQKDQDLAALLMERRKIEQEAVDKITKSLTDCSEREGLYYFECLAENADLNMQLMEFIRDKSRELISKYQQKFAEINANEEDCLMNTIEMAKIASDNAFDDLKSCLNGGPAIESVDSSIQIPYDI